MFNRFSSLLATPERIKEVEFRLNQHSEREKAKEVDSILQGKGRQGESEWLIEPITEKTLMLEYIFIEEKKEIIDKVRDGDPLILRHLSLIHNVDEIITTHIEPFDTLDRIFIDTYSMSSREKKRVTELLVPEMNKKEYQKVLLRTLMNLFDKSENSLVAINSFTPTLSIHLQEKLIEDRDYLMVKGESITLIFSAPYHTSKEITLSLKGGETQEVSVELEKILYPPMLISSNLSIKSSLPTIGEVSLPYIYTDPPLPLTITSKKPSYTSSHIIVDSPINHIDISLKRDHLQYSAIVPKVQGAFYTSLVRSVFVGGVTLVLSSLLPRSSFEGIDTLHSFFNGITLVSSVETIYRLFDYYEKTKYSSTK